MTAGEDEAKLIIRHRREVGNAVALFRFLIPPLQQCPGGLFGLRDLQVAQTVERLAPRSRRQPGCRREGQTTLWPALERRRQRVLQRILCKLKVSEQADQGG